MSDESEEDSGADGSPGSGSESGSGGLSKVDADAGAGAGADDGRPEKPEDDPSLRPDADADDPTAETDAADDRAPEADANGGESGGEDPTRPTDPGGEEDPASTADAGEADADGGGGEVDASEADDGDAGDAGDADASGEGTDGEDANGDGADGDGTGEDATGGSEDDEDGEDDDGSGGLRKVETDDDRPRSHKPNTMGPDDADEQAPPSPTGLGGLEDALPPGFGPSGGPAEARGGTPSDDGPPPGHAAGAPSPGEPTEDDEDSGGEHVRATDDGPGESGTVRGMGIDDGSEAAADAGADDAGIEDDASGDTGADDAMAGEASGIDPFPGPADADEAPVPRPEHGPDPGEGPAPPDSDHEPAPPEERPTEPVREEPDYGPFPDDGREPEGPPDDEEMPLAEHVEEMVGRLGVVVVAVAIVTALAFPFADEVLVAMWYGVLPPNASAPHVYGPLEKIMAEIKLASLAGVLVALPVLVYESYLFMRPGLYPKERRYYLAAVPTSLVLGAIGMAFAYFLILPVLFRYFIYYSESGVDKLAFGLRVTFDLIVAMLGSFALVFQIPLLMMLAIMMGVTNRRWIEARRLYFWGAFLGLGFLMGGADLTGMAPIIIAATMIGLFEGTLVLLRWTGR